MGTLNAVYVRAGGASIESAVQKIFPDGEVTAIETGQDFAFEPPHDDPLKLSEGFTGFILASDSFEPPHDDLFKLSKECGTDVIWLSFQSTVDAFEFHHWQAGSLLRSLVFGCYGEERTWERADGQPEPWEREAFFDPKHLETVLKYARSDDEKRELERIWRELELAPERQEPNIDGRESARKVAEFYNLPGWGL